MLIVDGLIEIVSFQESDEDMDPAQICLEQIKKDFKIYNREK